MEDSQPQLPFTFTTINSFWSNILFALLAAALLAGFLPAFPYNTYIGIVICIAGIFAAKWVADQLYSSEATIRIDGVLLSIEIFSWITKAGYTKRFDLTGLRGFEISESRYRTLLVLYMQDSSFATFSIGKSNEISALKALLSTIAPEITQGSNSKFPDFRSTMPYAFKRVLFAFLFSIGLAILLLFLHTLFPVFKSKTGIIWVLIFPAMLSFWLMIYLPLKKQLFRIEAFERLHIVFLFLANLIVFGLSIQLNNWSQRAVPIAALNSIIEYPSNRLFIISEPIEVIDSICLHADKTNRPRKSTTFSIDHYYFSPVINKQAVPGHPFYNFWITKNYHQKIDKYLDAALQRKQQLDFEEDGMLKFAKELKKKPTFYKIAHSDLVDANDFPLAAKRLRNTNYVEGALIVLEPHYESLDAYKSNLTFQILGIFAILMLLKFWYAAIIARGR